MKTFSFLRTPQDVLRSLTYFLLLTSTVFGGCTSTAAVLGVKKNAPNEFNILTKAPLAVPPEYNLRPPQAGAINVEEKYSTAQARAALIGEIDPAKPSQGENLLIAKAGGLSADPIVRAVINGQNSIERKTPGFSAALLADPRAAKPLDPDLEAQRLNAINLVTGGEKVQIVRRPAPAKLPGL